MSEMEKEQKQEIDLTASEWLEQFLSKVDDQDARTKLKEIAADLKSREKPAPLTDEELDYLSDAVLTGNATKPYFIMGRKFYIGLLSTPEYESWRSLRAKKSSRLFADMTKDISPMAITPALIQYITNDIEEQLSTFDAQTLITAQIVGVDDKTMGREDAKEFVSKLTNDIRNVLVGAISRHRRNFAELSMRATENQQIKKP